MRTVAVAIVFVLATFLSDPAQATTLTITEGTVTLVWMDTFANFSGDGATVVMNSATSFTPSGAFGTGTMSTDVRFGIVPGFYDVHVGNAACVSSFPGFADCGHLTLTSVGLALPPNWPLTENFVATVPFTAAGHLNVADGFDLVGDGVLTGIACFDYSDSRCAGTFGGTFVLKYTFAVAEPPTLALLIASSSHAVRSCALGLFATAGHVRALYLNNP